jgi:CRP-like cAMP-binding protein
MILEMNVLKALTDQVSALPAEVFEDFFSKFKLTKLRKGKIILNEGDVDPHLRIVVVGLIKAYKIIPIKNEGEKISINWKIDAKQIACSVISFFKQLPSVEIIETIEDSTILNITYADFQLMIEKHPSVSRLVTNWCIEYLVLYEKRMNMHRNPSPLERLKLFITNHPNIQTRISNTEKAAYLDMTASTLSRTLAEL